MTSSEPKMCLWIFCPQMTLHDIPKIPQIGVKPNLKFLTANTRNKNIKNGNKNGSE